MVIVDALVSPAECMAAFQDAALWGQHIYMAYAWATSSRGTAQHWRTLPRAKVRQAVLGLDFDETEPDVLRELRGLGVLRVISGGAGIFHPKVLVATNGTEARALVGSSNLTVGGFQKNVEVNVLLTGSAQAPALQKLLAFIDSHWEHVGVELDDATLAAYEQRYASRPAPREAPSADGSTRTATPEAAPGIASPADGVQEFFDSPGRVGEMHDAFMNWRRQHPGGFYLTVKTKRKANLHGCWCTHQGDYDFADGQLGSATRDRKVCAGKQDPLLEWARTHGIQVHRCGTCSPSVLPTNAPPA